MEDQRSSVTPGRRHHQRKRYREATVTTDLIHPEFCPSTRTPGSGPTPKIIPCADISSHSLNMAMPGFGFYPDVGEGRIFATAPPGWKGEERRVGGSGLRGTTTARSAMNGTASSILARFSPSPARGRGVGRGRLRQQSSGSAAFPSSWPSPHRGEGMLIQLRDAEQGAGSKNRLVINLPLEENFWSMEM